MACTCPTAPGTPADATYTFTGDTKRGGPGAAGVVTVYRGARLVTLAHRFDIYYGYSGGLGFPPAPYLSLYAFSSYCSGVPWETLGVGGYDVSLSAVAVDDDHDRRCVAWFKSLGCRVWDRGSPL